MISSRVSSILRHGIRTTNTTSWKALSSSSVPTTSVPETTVPPHDNRHPDLDDSEQNSVQVHTTKMRTEDKDMVFSNGAPPDPVLPAHPEEVAALDPAMATQDPFHNYAGQRRVCIRQDRMNNSQQPSIREKGWVISFSDDGAGGETWNNQLMGWVSGADSMASSIVMQMRFKNAKDAVYFAKKRGWNYEVEKPRMRIMRTDKASYQDNFLPQDVAFKIRKEKQKCDHWHRDAAGASHYFRPLKYHGDGIVVQHGPTGEDPVAPDADSYYKTR